MKTTSTQAPPPVPRPPASYLPLGNIARFSGVKYRPLDPDHVASLKASIVAQGRLNSPISVWDGGAEFPTMKVNNQSVPSRFLEAGNHRYAALRDLHRESPDVAKKLFPQGIPVYITTGELRDFKIRMLSENLSRKNPSMDDVYPVVMSLLEDHKMSKGAVATRLGVSPSYISQVVSVRATLGEDGEKQLAESGVSMKHALKAVKAVKSKATSAPEAVKAAVKASAEEKASGQQRAPRRVSPKRLLEAYRLLPSMDATTKLSILENVLAYAAGERENLPREIRKALNADAPAAA